MENTDLCSQKRQSGILDVRIQLAFCYITLLRGGTCPVPTVDSEVPPAFLLICYTTHMSQGGAETRAGGTEVDHGQKAVAACHKRTSVCSQRLWREGHKQKKNPAEELQWQLCLRVQRMLGNWRATIGW